MTLAEAVELIRLAVGRSGGSWADLGAGEGLFTRALARLLGPAARIHAIDNDPTALAALADLAQTRAPDAPEVVVIRGDIRHLDAVAALRAIELDGALFANALHFVRDPQPVLRATARRLADGGRVVIVEYERRRANPWVPYPIPLDALVAAAADTGLAPPVVVAERPSRYGGTLYCAVLEARPSAG